MIIVHPRFRAAESICALLHLRWELIDADRREAGFVARSLEEQQTLSFSVTTRNDRGDVGRADVTVVVAADPDFGTSGEVGEGPSARAGGDRTVEGGVDVTLSGSASTGSELSYSWKQVSGKPQVSLSGAETVRSTFSAPAFAAGTTNEYGFELTVSDDQNRSSRDTVTIRIRDPSGSNNETGGSEPGAKPRVRFETTVGEFVIEVEPDLVPETVANLLRYVRDDFYIGLIFHRALPDFVVQGGGFTPRMARAETRDPIDLEVSGLSNTRTSVGMARLVDPDSATSQFYVNVVDNSEELDPSATNDGYSVFGHVVEGMAVIDAIANVRTANRGLPPDQFFDVPVVDIIINAVTIE